MSVKKLTTQIRFRPQQDGQSTKYDPCMVINRRQFMKFSSATLCTLSLSACSSQINRHGHLFDENDISQVQQGMSKDQVTLTLGTPDTTASFGGGVYYYISQTTQTKAFLKPKIIDRKVLAVYFSPEIETVTRVANYGLQDGKVIDFISRTTPSHGSEASLLKQLFRNLGPSKNLFGG